MSFFAYPYAALAEVTVWPEYRVRLASLDDLACMKLAAIAQRGLRKDFIDLYALALRHRPLQEMLYLYKTRYAIHDIGHILVALTYFDDAEEEAPPVMLQDMPWENIKHHFQYWVKILSR